jgi:3-deoxy-alpha-D-manno-octulosonate 8-oxidase
VDHFFTGLMDQLKSLGQTNQDKIIFISTEKEPSTDVIDGIVGSLRASGQGQPCVVVGIGGGITLDTAKAVSNLLRNGGTAADYQGWDLVKVPGIYKIGVPTLSGTGAETTRTCVMTNYKTGLKLGMNSDFTVFDHIIMDPDLTATVPRHQFFYTGMDAYIHCIESLAGSYHNAIGDAYSRETIRLCREVFLSDDMQSAENREKMMVASYLGGCAIACSYVGVVHPFSAALSVVLGTHHCVANCIVMRAMGEFYPQPFDEFWTMARRQGVEIPEGICRDLTDAQYSALYEATVIHKKPLTNALGEKYLAILTPEKVKEVFRKM